MRILVVGAGGVGGYLGSRMIQKGQQVAFLLRSKTKSIVKEAGISLNSPLGDWAGPVDIADKQSGLFDLIVVSCKAFDLDVAIQDIGPFVGKDTCILPLLNGVQHIARLSIAFPQVNVLGGVAHIGATTEGPGRIIHLNTIATFLAGPLRESEPVPTALRHLFTATDSPEIKAQIVEDAFAQMWTKLVFLATLAASTCLHDADIGTILERCPSVDPDLLKDREVCYAACAA